ncbi:conserved hypothetical protein [Thiomonas sp. CB3]|nr:conserved hypothetical protein [Thiomonas sp. CB3]
MVALVDTQGNPLPSSIRPQREPQTASVGLIPRPLGNHPANGLTPARLASLLAEADGGWLQAQAALAADMQERDAHLFAELSKRRRALLTANWSLIAPEGVGASVRKQIASLEARIRGELDVQNIILDLADGILKGYACSEMEWGRAADGWWWPKAITLRDAEWFSMDAQGRFGLQTPKGPQPLQPLGWLFHRHAANSGYLGRSGLVRVLAWPYLFRHYAARDWAEFLEIHGLPMRLGRYPIGATEQERNTLMQAVVGIGHAAAGILPEGMAIEFQEATTGAADPYKAMVDWAEGATSKALLGGTLTTTVNGKGSYAAATVHNEVRQDLLESDLRQIAATLTRDLVRPLVALNTALPVAPQWLFAFDQTEDIAVWADAMPKLVSVGVQVPAAWAAQRLGIPAPQNGEAVLTAAPVAAPAPPTGQAGAGRQQTAAATAALTAQPAAPQIDQPAPPDDAAGQLAAQAAPAIAAWIDRIAALADQAESLEALKGLVLAAYGTLPRDQLTQALAAATLTAHLAGRYDVHTTGA